MAATLGKLNPFRYRGYVYDEETGLYYLRSRYYNPEWSRFISSDTVMGKVGAIGSHNVFVYCANNPIKCVDPDGRLWDTVWDVASLIASVIDVATHPNDPIARLSLAGDILDLVPFVSGTGEFVKLSSNAVEAIDTLHDTNLILENTDDVLGAAGASLNKVDFYITDEGVAIPATRSVLNQNLSMLERKGNPPKYYGVDSVGRIRIAVDEIHDPTPNFTGTANAYHTIPHMHIDRYVKKATGGRRWSHTYTGSMEMIK